MPALILCVKNQGTRPRPFGSALAAAAQLLLTSSDDELALVANAGLGLLGPTAAMAAAPFRPLAAGAGQLCNVPV